MFPVIKYPLLVMTSICCVGLSVGVAGCATTQVHTVGADMPFVTHEAEASGNVTTGLIVRLLAPPTGADSSPELEASGRAFVSLDHTGEFLEIPVGRPANALVVRHSIPDRTEGGGQTASLSLYVNGERRQTLLMESRHNWLYGDPTKTKRTDMPVPGLPAYVYWDEARYRLTGPELQPGDRIRLQKDEGDAAEYYHIDLVDLELAPPPLMPPSDGPFLSVVDFGAGGGDAQADTDAIKACITAAKEQGKAVWMPPGRYYQTEQFVLDGVKLRGAGMWHTELIGTRDTSVRDFGFRIAGRGAEVHDLFMENPPTVRRGSGAKAFTSAPGDRAEDWRVENVWVAHSHVGFWMSGANRGVVRDCRVRFTYADSLTFNHGSSDNLIENNHVRGVGDDGLATLSEVAGGTHQGIRGDVVSRDNIFRNNTVVANWWGHNADLAGGSGHVFENNYLADNSAMGCFTINHPRPYPMAELTDSVVRGNVIVRGGGRVGGQLRGAFWVFTGSSGASGVVVEDNVIVDSLFRAIHLTGPERQDIHFLRNRIKNPGGEAVYIQKEANGAGEFIGNRVSGAIQPIWRNDAGSDYRVEGSDNTW